MVKSARDIFVVGNNWGEGRKLEKIAQVLSKKHKVDAYFGSPSAFSKVSFRAESKETQALIAESIEKAKLITPHKPKPTK